VEPVTSYVFHDLTLAVQQEVAGLDGELAQTLADLSWARDQLCALTPSLSWCIRPLREAFRIPPTASRVLQADGFYGYEHGDRYYLTSGIAQWHLNPGQRLGEAWLASAFADAPTRQRRSFWGFGLLKLLRSCGLFGLHAAAAVSPAGVGFLIVGAPGSGKSTLALGLLRQGWWYLSDDVVLLRLKDHAVEALGCRQDAYVDAEEADRYASLPWGEEVSDGVGKSKRRLCIAAAYPKQIVPACVPRVLLLPRIVDAPRSTLRALGRTQALRQILTQSGPQLFDRMTMDAHLTALTHLLEQAVSYELQAGRDLYAEPQTLADLVSGLTGVR
jgi:hypothetical protein